MTIPPLPVLPSPVPPMAGPVAVQDYLERLRLFAERFSSSILTSVEAIVNFELAKWGGRIPLRALYGSGTLDAESPLRAISTAGGFRITGGYVCAALSEAGSIFLLPECMRPQTASDFREGRVDIDAGSAGDNNISGTAYWQRLAWSDTRASTFHHMCIGLWPGTLSGTINEVRVSADLEGLNCRGVITRTINGNAVSLAIPRDLSNPKLVYIGHGAGADCLSHISSGLSVSSVSAYQQNFAPLIQTLLANGCFLVASDGGAGAEGVALNDAWGNAASWVNTQAAIDWVEGLGITFSCKVALGVSMGGLETLRVVAYREGFTRWYGIDPVCSLKGPSNNGQASVAAWTATILNRHGVGSVAALPAGEDPTLFPSSVWTGKSLAATVSAADTSVPTANNATPAASGHDGDADNHCWRARAY